MDFLVFMFLLVMIAISLGGLLYVIAAFIQDVCEKRWNWVCTHLVTGPVLAFILYYHVDLMTKFANA